VLIDNFKMIDGGHFREAETRALLASGPYPCRNIDENMADLAAQVAANETGVREVRKMIAPVRPAGGPRLHAPRAGQRRGMRAPRDLRPQGRPYDYELDNGEFIRVAVRVDHERREAEIDFTGTADRNPFNYNAPLAVCHAVVLYVFRTLVGAPIPLNEGLLQAAEDHRAGRLDGQRAVSGGGDRGQHRGQPAGLQRADGRARRDGGVAGDHEQLRLGQRPHPELRDDLRRHGRRARLRRMCERGADAHDQHPHAPTPRCWSSAFPVRLEEWSIRRGSGGAGAHRGGDGSSGACASWSG
jgi:5-oxoprolinase (ATP-hydrolysing)